MDITTIMFFYLLCGFITFSAMKVSETEEFTELKRTWRILIRLSYILFWPIYFIRSLGLLLWYFIKMLIE